MKNKVIPFITALICLITLSLVSAMVLLDSKNQMQSRYYFTAENEAQQITTTIDCIMARAGTLQAMVRESDGDVTFFDRTASNVYESVTVETGVSLKNIAIAPDGIVSKVYPYDGNESLIGFNFLDLSKEGNFEAKKAYEEGQIILTNPFDLVQGGKGFAGRCPVFIGDNDQKKLWGLVTVTIDYDNFIDTLKLDSFTKQGTAYELSFIDDKTMVNVMETNDIPMDNPVVYKFAVKNLTWQLSLCPAGGWIPTSKIMLSAVIVLVISAFAGVIADILIKKRDSANNPNK